MKRAGQATGASLARRAGAIQGRLRRPDMLRSDTQADEPGGNARQPRQPQEETQEKRRPGRSGRAQDGHDHALLDDDLEALDDAGRKLAPSLDPIEISHRHPPPGERRGKKVGGGHGILDGEVDADTAHG